MALSPTESQKELAELRMGVCNSCQHKETFAIVRCGLCGCPLGGKVYSPVPNACPAKKWEAVEKEFFEKKIAEN